MTGLLAKTAAGVVALVLITPWMQTEIASRTPTTGTVGVEQSVDAALQCGFSGGTDPGC